MNIKKIIASVAVAIVLIPAISFAGAPHAINDLEAQRIQMLEQLIVLLKARVEFLIALLGQQQKISTTISSTALTTSATTTPAVAVKKKKGSGGGGGSSGGSSSANRIELERQNACILALSLKDAPLETKIMYLGTNGAPVYEWWGANSTEELYAYILGWLKNHQTTGAIYYQHNTDYTYPYAISHFPILETRLIEYYRNQLLCGQSAGTFETQVPTISISSEEYDTGISLPNHLRVSSHSTNNAEFIFKVENGGSIKSIDISDVVINITTEPYVSATDLINSANLYIGGIGYSGIIENGKITFSNLPLSVGGFRNESYSLQIELAPVEGRYESGLQARIQINDLMFTATRDGEAESVDVGNPSVSATTLFFDILD